MDALKEEENRVESTPPEDPNLMGVILKCNVLSTRDIANLRLVSHSFRNAVDLSLETLAPSKIPEGRNFPFPFVRQLRIPPAGMKGSSVMQMVAFCPQVSG